MNSVLQKDKKCWVCGATTGLHSHHVFYGTANRKTSEALGLKIWLCGYHHNLSNVGIHFNKAFDLAVKKMAQEYYENNIGTREEFIFLIGRSYL